MNYDEELLSKIDKELVDDEIKMKQIMSESEIKKHNYNNILMTVTLLGVESMSPQELYDNTVKKLNELEERK